MQNDRCLLFAVRIDVGQFKSSRQQEVKLAGRQRNFRADGRFDFNVKLRPIEGSFANRFKVFDTQRIQNFSELRFRLIPHLIIIEVLFLVFRIS